VATPGGKRRGPDETARLEALLERDPKSLEIFGLADAYTRTGRFADAVRACKQGLKHHPDSALGYVTLGRALFGAGSLPKAIQALRRALALDTSSSEPFRLLGEVLLWHGAPTEALALLEEAVELGRTERAILALLERARQTVDEEKTGVRVTTEGQRGLGNVMVAGTIGVSSVEVADEVTREVPAPDDDVNRMEVQAPRSDTTAPEADQEPGSFHPPVEEESEGSRTEPAAVLPDACIRVSEGGPWTSVQRRWERQLDARTLEPFPELDSDVRHPIRRGPASNIPLDPLLDPLTEGMPPLPPDPEGSTSTPLPVRGDTASTGPAAPVVSPPPEVLLPPETEAQDVQSMEDVHVSAAPLPSGAQEVPSAERAAAMILPAPDAAPPVASDHSAPEEKAGDLRLLEAMVEASMATPAPVWRGREPGPSVSHGKPRETTGPAAVSKRPRNLVAFLLGFVLVSCAAAAGVMIWRRNAPSSGDRRALAMAARARRTDKLEDYEAARAALTASNRRGGPSDALSAEAQLMAGLMWLEHRVGEPPRVAGTRRSWPQALAQAAAAVADHEPSLAVSRLEGEPKDPSNRAVRALLLAWAAWREGQPAEARKTLEIALRHQPDLAAAHLLDGYLCLESKELVAAERAFRRTLQLSPGHDLAAFGVAAVLLDQHPASIPPEIDTLLAHATRSPVGQLWRRLLQSERQLRNGEGVAVREIQPLVASIPAAPALLYRGAEILITAGEVDAALEILARLKRAHSDRDPAVRFLEAQLEVAQGLEAKAVQRFRDLPQTARVKRELGRALLFSGQPEEAEHVLEGDESDEAKTWRVVAAALRDKRAPVAPLQHLAESLADARLGLALVLLSRGEAGAAAQAAETVTSSPLLAARGLTLMAQVQDAEDQVDRALSSLEGALRRNPRFMPASELLGRIYVRVGRYPEAVVHLQRARTAGRATVPLLLALLQAQVLSGRPVDPVLTDEIQQLGGSRAEIGTAAALVDLAAGKLEKAAALADDTSDGTLLLALGDGYLREGETADAESVWKNAMASAPADPLPYLRLGRLYAKQGTANATFYYEGAITRASRKKYYPRDIPVQAHLGIARYYVERRKMSPTVLSHIRAAIQIDGSASDAFRLLGETSLLAGNWKEAREALERCVALNPEDATAFYLLGLSSKSEPKRARHALVRFLELEPKGKRAAQARRALGRRR
jgi:tetratricopeptide (TPR) repeat protein